MRAAVKGPTTTVDLMAGMGLKYVHATSKGRKGQMGDLEKSREQVWCCEYVFMHFYICIFMFYIFCYVFIMPCSTAAQDGICR